MKNSKISKKAKTFLDGLQKYRDGGMQVPLPEYQMAGLAGPNGQPIDLINYAPIFPSLPQVGQQAPLQTLPAPTLNPVQSINQPKLPDITVQNTNPNPNPKPNFNAIPVIGSAITLGMGIKEGVESYQAKKRTDRLRGYFDQDLAERKKDIGLGEYVNTPYSQYKEGGIHIDPKNKGAFTREAKRRGMGVQEFANKVMANKEDYSPLLVKRANFARNAAKWEDGGLYPTVSSDYNTTVELANQRQAQAMELLQKMQEVEQLHKMMYGGEIEEFKGGGEMIKRADGSYSQVGLWDRIRANRGSGKKPTKEMLKQERKIRREEMEYGGYMPFMDSMDENNQYMDLPEFGNGGYKVERSNDRKGKTHKVTGPDGSVKYFGDPNMGERSKSKYGKEAFYARHKSNLEKNPHFRAYARATWQNGGQVGLKDLDKCMITNKRITNRLNNSLKISTID